jgi:hypothetical protein
MLPNWASVTPDFATGAGGRRAAHQGIANPAATYRNQLMVNHQLLLDVSNARSMQLPHHQDSRLPDFKATAIGRGL